MLTIKKVDFNDIPYRHAYSRTKNLELIDEFLKGDYEAAEITDNSDPNRLAKNIVSAMNESIKRAGHSAVLVAMLRGGKAYLVRKSLLA